MKHEIVHDMQGELRHVTIAGAPAETPRVPPSASDRVVPLRPAASVAPVTSNLSKPDSRSVPAAPMFEHRGRPASSSMAKEDPLPEPVPAPIQVTIGRIEVRASHAPAPAPVRASRTPDPKLSLNDYLASRRKDAQ